MKLNLFSSVAALAIAAVAPSVANATVTISNTGVANAWSVSSDANPTYGTPATSGPAVTITTVPGVYVANSATSQWISVNSAGVVNPGYYTYSTIISASAANDTLSYRFAVDDYVTAVLLDGVSVASATLGGTYGSFTSSTITGISAGQHNLAFVTGNNFPGQTNGANPAGFRLEAAVPEPATWGLMVLGFGAIGGAMRTSRRKVTFA